MSSSSNPDVPENNESDPKTISSKESAAKLTESIPPPVNTSDGKATGPSPEHPDEIDAPFKEIVYYGVGGVVGSLSGHFYNLWNFIALVVLGMNPLVFGFILAIKTMWDGITDPLMAHLTDNIKTRWGRRRPFILVGGAATGLFIFLMVLVFPHKEAFKTNEVLGKRQAVTQTVTTDSGKENSKNSATESTLSESGSNPAPAPAPPPIKKKLGFYDTIKDGLNAFVAVDDPTHKTIAFYLLVCSIIFTTLTTVHSVPYYALGIEICPSYDGRTKVVTFRSMVEKPLGLLGNWITPFCLLPIFYNILGGLFWYTLFTLIVGTTASVLMVKNVKERTKISAVRRKKVSLFKSMWQTGKNVHFLKILFLYQFIGYTNGIFAQVGMLLGVYWVFHGNAAAGALLGGYVSTIAWGLSFIMLPVINWACRKFSKHQALRAALLWMSIGTALKWVLVTPDAPYLQLILPFFFSIGISCVYTILPSMMADVTDIDELQNGVRREGMFGAVMAFLMKVTGTMQPLIAGAVVVIAGFDMSKGADQAEQVFTNMRLMFSLIPAGLLLMALLILWRYPLTRERMAEVKAILKERRALAEANAAADNAEEDRLAAEGKA